MKRQGSPNQKKLQKVSEVSSNNYESVPNPQVHKLSRISLSSFMAKKSQKKSLYTNPKCEEVNVGNQERRIKQLQEAIMDKKHQNDAIQYAFRQRKEASNFFSKDEFPELKLKIIGKGCIKITSRHKLLKKTLLKSLVTALKFRNTNNLKCVKNPTDLVNCIFESHVQLPGSVSTHLIDLRNEYKTISNIKTPIFTLTL